ncbi:hypothetical protein WICMUC_001619 [Wickerhamomyces mucosus]|uniref:Gluconokinase n=1 Tax=Wickerhamomyces mucosus TaxID=1378264 RepID=A0A9P8PTY7_9ASCO|nr:hypothetical protein WICMUC_001619 [Wickerhamomyces mucosus]
MGKVVVIAGTAGTGKSTIGDKLKNHYKAEFIEGDDLHPQSNIDKMANNIPLTDEDRWGWLEQISLKSSTSSNNNSNAGIAIVSCSALKKKYRDFIRDKSPQTTFIFVFLYCDYDVLIERTKKRQGHYMKASMVQSQFDILELPKAEEEPQDVIINVTHESVDIITKTAIEFIDKQ